ncbi:MAG: hypothetical protein P8103_18115 [Candidatus Thiodiazotropha sp.]
MVVTLLLLSIGLLFAGYAFFLLFRRRRLMAASVNGFIGLPFLLVGGFFSLLLLNLQTYQQLTHEVTLAEVHIGQPTDQGLPLRLVYTGHADTFFIQTTQWRLDARFVKWKPWMSLFGKEPIVRLERLEERGVTASGRAVMNRHNLASTLAWTDEIISSITDHIGLIDSVFGSSVYMPAVPGAEYVVTASISGLVARPLNAPAQKAVLEWSRQ